MEAEAAEKADEWELLPPNTSFLDFGLEDIKDLFSKEIEYTDYFTEQPQPELNPVRSGDEKPPLQQPTKAKFVPEIESEDPKESELEENGRIDEEEQKYLADKPRCDRRRRLAAGLSEVLSIGAAVAAAMICGFLIGSGRRQEQVRRADAMRFRVCKDDEALKQMVRQANRINRALVATASGMPPPAMTPATISFGGCFSDVL